MVAHSVPEIQMRLNEISSEMISILITGVTGFVGQEVCHQLRASGYAVTGTTRDDGL